MMQPPRGYPKEIEQKVNDEVGSRTDPDSFNTENQYQTAMVIRKNWPAQFKEMAKEAPVSRPIVADVIEKFFGPKGTDLTFGEIEEEFGSYESFERARKEGTVEEQLNQESEEESEPTISDASLNESPVESILNNPRLPDSFSKRDLELYMMGRQDGFEDGFEHGWNARGQKSNQASDSLDIESRHNSGSITNF